jgi:murein DD-endopeptidase MepM/ murein hydrolase activator NlpD
MASGFGYRTDPFTKARKMHEGMDFTAKTGTLFMQLVTEL